MSEGSDEAGECERDDLPGPREGDAPRTNVAVVIPESQLLVEVEGEPTLEREASSSREGDSPEVGILTRRKPIRHCNTYQKGVKWSLEINQPVIVVGDSNLSKIPEFQHPLVQIDSFPGAQILHLKEILGKLNPCLTTQKVILSVGLNNCLRRNRPTTIKKQFQQLLSRAKTIFPRAEIVIPLIQFSPRLQPECKTLLEEVNIFLEANFRTLKGIEENQFRVSQKDLIHWTAGTATKILNSWMSQLN